MEGYQFDNLSAIKIMVLFATKHMKRAVSGVEITDLLGEYANYFIIARAMAELVDTALLQKDEDKLTLTEKGHSALEGFGSEIPFSVREKILETIAGERKQEREKTELLCECEKINEISYLAHMGICQGDETLFHLTVNVGSRSTAEALTKSFLHNPEQTYDKIMAVLLAEADE